MQIYIMTYLDFLICHPITYAGIKFIEGLPCQFRVREILRGLYCAPQRRRPYLDGDVPEFKIGTIEGERSNRQRGITNVVDDECRQSLRILQPTRR